MCLIPVMLESCISVSCRSFYFSFAFSGGFLHALVVVFCVLYIHDLKKYALYTTKQKLTRGYSSFVIFVELHYQPSRKLCLLSDGCVNFIASSLLTKLFKVTREQGLFFALRSGLQLVKKKCPIQCTILCLSTLQLLQIAKKYSSNHFKHVNFGISYLVALLNIGQAGDETFYPHVFQAV